MLQEASAIDERLVGEAAECYRQAGQIHRALVMNAQVVDPKQQVQQRVGLLLEQQDYEGALALHGRLSRHGLLQDDAVSYGLAYAAYRIGDVDRSEGYLQGISEPEWFRNATALRQAIAACTESGGC